MEIWFIFLWIQVPHLNEEWNETPLCHDTPINVLESVTTSNSFSSTSMLLRAGKFYLQKDTTKKSVEDN